MEIRGVGGVNPTDRSSSIKASKPTSSNKIISKQDTLKVSDEARLLEDEVFIKEVLAKIPDIDQNKIDLVKKRLESGEYNNKETMDILTSRLAKILGL